MITIGPYRLYQIAKYAWQRWSQQPAGAAGAIKGATSAAAAPTAQAKPSANPLAGPAASVRPSAAGPQAGRRAVLPRDRIGSGTTSSGHPAGLGLAHGERFVVRGSVGAAGGGGLAVDKTAAWRAAAGEDMAGQVQDASGTRQAAPNDAVRSAAPSPLSSDAESSTSATLSHPDSALDDRIHRSSADEHPPSPSNQASPLAPSRAELNEISRLMADATLFTPEFKPPRNIVVLCHGLYGFSTATPIPLFPSLKLHYWASVLDHLRDALGCKVIVVGVKGTGSIEERAKSMHKFLEDKVPAGTGLNFVAHSMGGLDCRYLISHIKPTTYKPLSLTMIGTPNRGSPFMDWCAANIGVGSSAMVARAVAAQEATRKAGKLPPYSLKSPLLSRPSTPRDAAKQAAEEAAEKAQAGLSGLLNISSLFGSGITDYLLNLLDSPAYGNLTTHYLNDSFNPSTPDDPSVKYTSVAGRINKMSVLHPLWFPKLVLDAAAQTGYAEEEGQSGKDYEGNDGLVSVSSAKWGEWLGVVDGCHHWELRGEGGLLPNGPSITDKPEGRPDPSSPDGWDWKSSLEGTKKPEYKESSAIEGIARMETLKQGAVAISEAAGKSGQAIRNTISENMPTSVTNATQSWDVAQVKQVVDWVADMLPAGADASQAAGVGSKQMADAVKEKAREDARDGKSSMAFNNVSGLHQTGKTGQRERSGEEKKRDKAKFDLGRFYGGLMVKLREDGF